MTRPLQGDRAQRVMLGWREWVGLPGLGLSAVRAKIDSGARSSALHVDAYWRFSEGGAPWVGFRLSNDGHGEATVQAAAPIFDEREVIDSGGHRTRRIFLRTPLLLAGIERVIEVNLTDRQGMLFPMLLGRTAMAKVFAVDPGRSFLHGKPQLGVIRGPLVANGPRRPAVVATAIRRPGTVSWLR